MSNENEFANYEVLYVTPKENSDFYHSPSNYAKEKNFTGFILFNTEKDERNFIVYYRGYPTDGSRPYFKKSGKTFVGEMPPEDFFCKTKKVTCDKPGMIQGIPFNDFAKRVEYTGLIVDTNLKYHWFNRGIPVNGKDEAIIVRRKEDLPPADFTGKIFLAIETEIGGYWFPESSTVYLQDGKLHREDGPAVFQFSEDDGCHYLHGKRISFNAKKITLELQKDIDNKRKITDFLCFNVWGIEKTNPYFTELKKNKLKESEDFSFIFADSTNKTFERFENEQLNCLYGAAVTGNNGVGLKYVINGTEISHFEYRDIMNDFYKRNFTNPPHINLKMEFEISSDGKMFGVDHEEFVKNHSFTGTICIETEKGWNKKCYFNGHLHDVYGPASYFQSKNDHVVENEKFYLSGINFTKNKWESVGAAIKEKFEHDKHHYFWNYFEISKIKSGTAVFLGATKNYEETLSFSYGDFIEIKNGKIHSEDGPAVIRYNGDCEWILSGQKLTFAEWEKKREEKLSPSELIAREIDREIINDLLNGAKNDSQNIKETIKSVETSIPTENKLVNVVKSDALEVAKRIAVNKITGLVKISLIKIFATSKKKSAEKTKSVSDLENFFSTSYGIAIIKIVSSLILSKVSTMKTFTEKQMKTIQLLATEFRIQSETEVSSEILEKIISLLESKENILVRVDSLTDSFNSSLNSNLDLVEISSETNQMNVIYK